MYMRALQSYEETLRPNYTSTLNTVNELGILYKNRGKLTEAKAMFMPALQGYMDVLGPAAIRKHRPALNTIWNLGILLKGSTRAETIYTKVPDRFENLLGPCCTQCEKLRRAFISLGTPKEKV
jgi:hypothetical protein